MRPAKNKAHHQKPRQKNFPTALYNKSPNIAHPTLRTSTPHSQRRQSEIGLYEDSSEKKLRLKQIKQQQQMEIVFFIFELLIVCIISGVSIWILIGDFPLILKPPTIGILAYIIRVVIRHMTTKGN